MVDETFEYEKYVTDKAGIKAMVEKYGVAVVPNVINAEECKSMVSGMWDYFEHISANWEKPLNRSDKKTWRGIYDLFPLHSMLFQHFNCGHAQASWDLRQNEKIVDIFVEIWNCERDDLLVSFDGFSFGMPPESTNRGWNGKPWYHTDQSYMRPDFECIQSWVTGLDVEEGDATLGVMEGSNKYHAEFREKFGVNNNADWYKLTDDEMKFYVDKGCEYKRINCPKGSMVFWDSRTIHCGVGPLKGRKSSDMRAVIYLCYQPKSMCDAKNWTKKVYAFKNLRTTNHYPCKVKLFAENPRTYGMSLPDINVIEPPILTNLGKSLAGLT